MGLTILGVVGETVTVWATLTDTNGDPATDRFPQVRILERDGTPTPLAILDMAHQSEGSYFVEWTVPSASKFLAEVNVYDDAAHTIRSFDFDRDSDLIISDASGAPAPRLKAVFLNPQRSP